MTSPASASGLDAAYHRLHPKIQRWIRDQGWDELREIQARTIVSVLEGDRDILIAATTAAGKTEAAFLPIMTSIADRKQAGFSALYISPLKALINDQFRRLEELCESMEIPVVKWHGDAPQAEKKKALAKPDGIALITPESIEAMFTRRPADARRLLGSADYLANDVPPYLDGKAQELLAEGREFFRQLQLHQRSLVSENRDVHIFLWRGSQATAVFSAALAMAGLASGVHDLGVSVSKIKESQLVPILKKLAGMGAIDPATVAEFVANIQAGKFREVVPEDLARALWARRNGDVVGGISSMAGALD